MCGIGGAIAIDPSGRPDERRVRRMSELLQHRGPDGEGLWQDPTGRVMLAHRRLAIIDLATGQQPMVASDEAMAIVFNGVKNKGYFGSKYGNYYYKRKYGYTYYSGDTKK